MSISTGPIFAKFARMVELWLDMNDLNLVLRSVKGRYHGNQFFSSSSRNWVMIQRTAFLSLSDIGQIVGECSVLFLSRPRSEGWPHHGRTFSIYLSSVILIDSSTGSPVHVLMVFLACVHLAFSLALFLSPGNSLVSSWCDHSMLASLLWQCLTVSTLLQLC